MIDLIGYEDTPAVIPGEFLKLPAGGYVCSIFNAEVTLSKAGNPMLVLYLDIIEGEFARHFRNAFERVRGFRPDIKWDNSGVYRQLIFDKIGKVSSFFKGLLTCIEKSNSAFHFNPRTFDAQILRGCLIGFIFAEEEYRKNDGSIDSRTFAKFPKPVDVIRSGNFTVPDAKKLEDDRPSTPKPKATGVYIGEQVDIEDPPF